MSVAALVYFARTGSTPNFCFFVSLAINLALVASQLLIVIPMLRNTLRSHGESKLVPLLARATKNRLKSIAMSRKRAPIFTVAITVLSVLAIYTLISTIFVWRNFEYLFTMVCLVGCSLNDVCLYIRVRCDSSSSYAAETYKFFMLVLASIFFGISAAELSLNMFVMSMSWLFFLKSAKESLEKDVVYYLLVFVNITFFITAFVVILASKKLVDSLMGSPLWFYGGVAFILTGSLQEARELYILYLSLSGDLYANYKNDSNKKIELYIKLQKIRDNTKWKEPLVENPEEAPECSICLEQIKRMRDDIYLECHHCFHLDCFE